jgi:hypothetical protein
LPAPSAHGNEERAPEREPFFLPGRHTDAVPQRRVSDAWQDERHAGVEDLPGLIRQLRLPLPPRVMRMDEFYDQTGFNGTIR